MKCVNCERRAPNVNLTRINAKGQPGVWLCDECAGKGPRTREQAIIEEVRGGK